MKVALVLVLLAVGISANAADRVVIQPRTREEVKFKIIEAKNMFLRLPNWLPWDRVYNEPDKYRAEWDKLIDDLDKAVSIEPASEQRIKLEEAWRGFRRLGLGLPFNAITAKKRDDNPNNPDPLSREGMISRYIIAEDTIKVAIDALVEIEPTSSKPWTISAANGKTYTLVWIGRNSVPNAMRRCPGEFKPEQKGHLIEALELQDVWRDMRKPEKNPVFGNEAATFKKVWTSTKVPADKDQPDRRFVDDPYYYFDFETNQPGQQAGDELYEAICVSTPARQR